MTRGPNMLQDFWHLLLPDPEKPPISEAEQRVFDEQAAWEMSGETGLSKAQCLKHAGDPRWEDFWQARDPDDDTFVGDQKAFKKVFGE